MCAYISVFLQSERWKCQNWRAYVAAAIMWLRDEDRKFCETCGSVFSRKMMETLCMCYKMLWLDCLDESCGVDGWPRYPVFQMVTWTFLRLCASYTSAARAAVSASSFQRPTDGCLLVGEYVCSYLSWMQVRFRARHILQLMTVHRICFIST